MNYPLITRNLAPLGFLRSPWTGLENEIDRLFESTLSSFAGAPRNQFPVDVYEDRDNTYVRAELPGVSRDDINVEMVEDALSITAQHKEDEESFSFSRTLALPAHVHADKVSANYENGLLTVILPKREEAKPRKISVAIK